MPRVQEGSFPSEAHGGVRIHTKAWLPDGLGADRLRDKVASPPSAVVLWSHGLHEHLGRFEKLHEALVAKNVAVYAWDHVGHGESGSCGEKRHQFPRGFDAVVADALQFARCERRDKTRGCRKKKTRARLFFSFRRVRQECFCNSLLASSSSSL
jgi:acylglycerol lipase